MKPLVLGVDENGAEICLPAEVRRGTHSHVVGGSNTGKSKFLESLIRQDLREGQGFCLIDWHGTLFDGVLRYCAKNQIGLQHYGFSDFRNVILLDPSAPDFITGFNPFHKREGSVSAQVSNLISATVKPWGVRDTNDTPTLERILRILYAVAIELGSTLPAVFQFLDFEKREFRAGVIERIEDPYIRRLAEHLQHYKSARDWDEQTLSTLNRLSKFIGSEAIRRHIGLESGNLDLMSVMEQGQILLVNLAQSPHLAVEEGRVFACWLLSEFFQAALRLAHKYGSRAKPPLFVLYLDEFQQYMTDDLAAMLDEVRKGGLHLVLAHQHLSHLDERLKKSVFTNVRVRAAFGGVSFEDGTELANEMFLPDLNTRQIKNVIYHTNHLYKLEFLESSSETVGRTKSRQTSESFSSGRSLGDASGHGASSGRSQLALPQMASTSDSDWVSEGEIRTSSESRAYTELHGEMESQGESVSISRSVQRTPTFVPIPVQELASETEWSLEEKRSRVAELLKYQSQRHCFVKIDSQQTTPIKTLNVSESEIDDRKLAEYKAALFKAQGAFPAAEVDSKIRSSEAKLFRAYASDQTSETAEVKFRSKTKLRDLVGSE